MEGSNALSFTKKAIQALNLSEAQRWKYETDDFYGKCELTMDDMVVRCVFECYSKDFYDVLLIDSVIKARLVEPVSVERLSEQLSADFPSLQVTVRGRAKNHGWITSTIVRNNA